MKLKKLSARGGLILALCALIMLPIVNTNAATFNWTSTKVYPNVKAEAGGFRELEGRTAIDKDSSGNNHIAFIDDQEYVDGRKGLFYAYEVGSGGDCDDLYPGGSDAYECAQITSNATPNGDYTEFRLGFELTSDNKPRIAFMDGDLALNYAFCDASCGNPASWTVTSVDDVSGFVHLALDSTNNPSILFGSGNLVLAEYVGGGLGTGCNNSDWTCTAIENTDTVNHGFLTFNSLDQEIVTFNNTTDSDVIYAVRTAGSGCSNSNWTCTVIDSAAGGQGSIVLDSDKPRVAYTRVGTETIYYTGCDSSCNNSGNWTTPESIMSKGDIPSIKIDPSTSQIFVTAGRETDDVMGEQVLAERVGSGGDCNLYGGTTIWECHDVDPGKIADDYGHGRSSLHLSSPVISMGTDNGAFIFEAEEDNGGATIPELPGNTLWKVLIAVLSLGLVVGVAAFLKKKKK